MEKSKWIKVTQYIFKQIKIGEFKKLTYAFCSEKQHGCF